MGTAAQVSPGPAPQHHISRMVSGMHQDMPTAPGRPLGLSTELVQGDATHMVLPLSPNSRPGKGNRAFPSPRSQTFLSLAVLTLLLPPNACLPCWEISSHPA